VPEIATTKIDGLRRYYGVTDPEGLAYFRVHEEADRVHRAAWREWLGNEEDGLEAGAKDLSNSQIMATAQVALNALWGALDAVQGAQP
jgi:pyrroloquinoline-quinone synthase